MSSTPIPGPNDPSTAWPPPPPPVTVLAVNHKVRIQPTDGFIVNLEGYRQTTTLANDASEATLQTAFDLITEYAVIVDGDAPDFTVEFVTVPFGPHPVVQFAAGDGAEITGTITVLRVGAAEHQAPAAVEAPAGVVLVAPDASRHLLLVANDGSLSTEPVA